MTTRHEFVERPYREVLRQALELPLGDQLRLSDELGRVLSNSVDGELQSSREVRARVEALAALERAAAHLGLEESANPKVAECDRAWRELGDECRSGRVIEAFGRWKVAAAAYSGARVPLPPAARALRSASSRQHRGTVDELIEPVRIWLATNPAKETIKTYDHFVRHHNDRLAWEDKPLPLASRLFIRLGLPWTAIKAVARGKKTPEQAYRERADRPMPADETWGQLVGSGQVAATLGITLVALLGRAARQDFPLPVAMIGNRRLWRKEDIDLYAAGERDPAAFKTKVRGELQSEILGREDIRRRMRITPTTIGTRLRDKRWHQVPEPEGLLSTNVAYWRRDKVEEWEAEHGQLSYDPGPRGQLARGQFSRESLEADGFQGWVSFREIRALDGSQIPLETRGVYLVYRSLKGGPCYLGHSPAGSVRGREPTIEVGILAENWVDKASVLYIGQANHTARKRNALRDRITLFARFGAGESVRHWAGRPIWQLEGSDELLVAWKPTPDVDPGPIKDRLLRDFRDGYAQPPYANSPRMKGR